MGYDRDSKIFPEDTSWCSSMLQDVKQIHQAEVTETRVSAGRENPPDLCCCSREVLSTVELGALAAWVPKLCSWL